MGANQQYVTSNSNEYLMKFISLPVSKMSVYQMLVVCYLFIFVCVIFIHLFVIFLFVYSVYSFLFSLNYHKED